MDRDIEPLARALDGYCGIADRNCAGLTEISSRVRGAELWLMDTILDPEAVESLADLVLGYKIDYWRSLFKWIKDHGLDAQIQVISECDDLGTQTSTLLSPARLQSLVIPRFKKLWSILRREMPEARMFFHSCGAIRPIIPDLIEAGMDILNPVQFTAAGMDLRGLKRDFGKDITFWGGGIDTQGTLVKGTPDEVKDDVKRILDIMAPGGGYVFAPVHNIQNDVPAANFWAMWETLMEFGRYR
jgi:uroporphyrinogen decarboxylase